MHPSEGRACPVPEQPGAPLGSQPCRLGLLPFFAVLLGRLISLSEISFMLPLLEFCGRRDPLSRRMTSSVLSGADVRAAGIFADVQHSLFQRICSHLHSVIGGRLSVSIRGCHEPWSGSSLVLVPCGTCMSFSCWECACPSPLALGSGTDGCTDWDRPVVQKFPRVSFERPALSEG